MNLVVSVLALVGVVLVVPQWHLKGVNSWVMNNVQPSRRMTSSPSTQALSQQGLTMRRLINEDEMSISYGRLSTTPPTTTSTSLFESIAADPTSLSTEDDDEDEEEWEEVELDILTESEFYGSEWLIGSVMDKKPNDIVETWVRLAVDKNGKNVAIWGDNAEGTWNFDVSNQFLSFSKQSILGKAIWAGVIDDYYYMLGTIRGYNLWTAAKVLGQWQAKRLGVEPGEAGIAPWFQEETQDDEDDVGAIGSSSIEDSVEDTLNVNLAADSDETNETIII